ncbi:hypothetical protein RJ639_028754 [Escallonia herrerae]|uniref:Diacylglycerol O-acyltransferase n=1 Tax=Escallonia herrerae TaxID=1293975 RepID=A0AA89BEA9_9ASTE|nr:hypothetical protein RJ639_028754 [Escallonia herrerae]
MDFEPEEVLEPVSPTGQMLKSSIISFVILGVLESEVPIRISESRTLSQLEEVFLPINPCFSSLMVLDKNGQKRWKRVEVKLKDHVKVPIFPDKMSLEYYDEAFSDYLSRISMEPLPKNLPLWEIHMFKYPTSTAAGNIIFKLHHALGDGYSLMGALLSCLQRADNPSLPLTFPSRQSTLKMDGKGGRGIFKFVPRILSGVINTMSDFGESILKSTVAKDDLTPIRPTDDGAALQPLNITSMTFSLDHIKQIKCSLNVTINDVITGVVLLGTRLYMEAADCESRRAHSTAVVLLNTRSINGYKSVSEMVKPNAEMPWGNRFAFLHVPIPKLTLAAESSDPLEFVLHASNIIKKKRNSSGVHLTGALLETIRKYKGSEAAAKYLYNTLNNSSIGVTNMIGPTEKMALENHPIGGLYFMVAGNPQSLTITMMSYMKKLRVVVGATKGHIDSKGFKSCVEKAFEMIFKAAVSPSSC